MTFNMLRKFSMPMLSQSTSTMTNLPLAKEVGADIGSMDREVDDVPGLIKRKTNGGAHSAVVTAVSKVAFNQAVDSVRAGGRAGCWSAI